MARLPKPGSDAGKWGDILNDYLSQAHNTDGTLKDISRSKVTGLQSLLDSKADTSSLGTAAFHNTTDLATAAQGTKADTAVQPNSLDASAADLIGDSESDTGQAIGAKVKEVGDSIFASLPAAYIDPSGMADSSTVTALTRGTLSASYGNSPAAINNGRVVHTPASGSTNSAAYIEANIGGEVSRIGCDAEWPAGSTGCIALVIPSSSWVGAIGSGTNTAGLHLICAANSNAIAISRYHGSQLDAVSYPVTTLAGTGIHRVEALLDRSNTTIYVYLDGVLVGEWTNATAFTQINNIAIWEIYEATGASEPAPAQVVSAWADIARHTPPAPPQRRNVLRQPVAGSKVDTSTSTYTIGTSLTNITSLTTPVTFGASGKAVCIVDCYIETTGTGLVLGAVSAQGICRIASGAINGRITYTVIYKGTAYSTTDLVPRLQVTGDTTCDVKVGGMYGVANFTVIPI